MSSVKLFGAVGGIISIKTHFKGAFWFSGTLDLSFLFMEEIWHDVKKCSWSIIRSISCQTLAVSPANNDLVYLWPNIWCNNYKSIFFLDGNIFVFDISCISPKNVCFLCALCGKLTPLLSMYLNFTVQNTLWNKQVCPKFINVIIENNLSHRSGAQSMLCNVAIKVSPLLLHILICTYPFLWHDVRLHLQCVYPFRLTNLK